ncbi:DUF2269 family protein [Paraconexibacter sp.]|uniref:DUF2269 family protein n=1 Tax=Paraconexibacter sp. TaxID=2949640 RepID=UPI0035678FF6
MPRAHDVALFLHLFGVLALVSGVVLAGAAHGLAKRREQPSEIAVVLSLARVGVLLVAPGTVLVIGGGSWLVTLEDLPLDTGWLSSAIALFTVALILGAVGGQRPKQARMLAQQLSDDDQPATPELRALLSDRRAQALNYASAIALIGVLALMVFKP